MGWVEGGVWGVATGRVLYFCSSLITNIGGGCGDRGDVLPIVAAAWAAAAAAGDDSMFGEADNLQYSMLVMMLVDVLEKRGQEGEDRLFKDQWHFRVCRHTQIQTGETMNMCILCLT